MSRDMTIDEFLAVHGNCDDELEWARTHYTTMQECWENLPYYAWLVWVAARPGVLTSKEKLQFALYCCDMVSPKLKNFKSVAAVEMFRRHVDVGISIDERRLATWAADIAWLNIGDERVTVVAAAGTVAAAVAIDPIESPDGHPCLSDMTEFAIKAKVDSREMMSWLRQNTKPNFTKKED